MISLFLTALTMGAVGSFHCIGMCGPLAISLPVINSNSSSRFVSTLLYNAGRVITYSFLGAIFGIVGTGFALFGYQQTFSVILGMLIILFIFLPASLSEKTNLLHSFFIKLRTSLGNLFLTRKYHSTFLIGLLNGLLPCGLIWLALMGAMSTGSVLKSMLFMAAFGLGTLPVMWTVAFFGGFINIKIRQRIKNLYPYMMFVVAVLLIIRGLSLNIPYISPGIHGTHLSNQPINCHD